MKKIVLVLGGARSGKSAFALNEANGKAVTKKAFIATAEVLDEEMRFRIEKHKEERGKDWVTFEEPLRIDRAIQEAGETYEVVILDCLTLWLSNIMHAGHNFLGEVEKLIEILTGVDSTCFYIVSNEVGLGLVPESPLGREFRDKLGILNQAVAQIATDVYFMAAGIPLKLKGGKPG